MEGYLAMADSRFAAICVFHLLVAVLYLVGLYGCREVTRKTFTGAPGEYAGFWKGLTYWNLIFHFVFFAVSFVIDVIALWSATDAVVLRIRDSFFAGIVFPYGVFVFFMFWAIVMITSADVTGDRNFPAWLNHILHTAILPAVLLELFLVPHQYPSRMVGYALTATVGAAYLLWLLFLGVVKNIWMYVFMKDFNWLGKTIFFVVTFAFSFGIYVLGEKLNHCFWSDLVFQSLH